jgi:glycosyltransferase involved in cell wall biosynthesis/predicted O-methyltransferase YrrM
MSGFDRIRGGRPTVDVLIPHLSEVDGVKLPEREEGLRRCLASLNAQSYDRSLIRAYVIEGPESVPLKVARAFDDSTGDFVVYASNDMEFDPDAIALAVEDSLTRDVALVAFDGGSVLPDEGNICEHFMIRRDFVPRLECGQVFSTDFHHAGCDNWLWAQAKRMGQAYRSTRAKVTHRHFSRTGRPMDEVYKRGWSRLAQDRKTLSEKMRGMKDMSEMTYTNDWFLRRIDNFRSHIGDFSSRPVRCLEIGSFEGQSANWIVENFCGHPESSLTCVDPFTGSVEHSDEEKEGLFERFTRNTADNALKIRVIREASSTALRRLVDSGEKFDFIYVDGDHHRDAVAEDAELAHLLLVPGGLLAFDDYTWGTGMASWQRPQDAIDDFLKRRSSEYDVVTKNDQVFTRKRQPGDAAKRPRIAVYAISKNESKFVERFCESCKDADLIVITDTGSTDDTVEKARSLGAIVHSISVMPWRFDVARNCSVALIPPDVDICVNLDLDEVLEPGWREEIERLWKPGETTRMRYLFDWGSGIQFMSDKIHARKGYTWRHPCHEAITPDLRIPQNYVFTEKLMVRHLPDPTKSRGQYLELLELGVKEDPHATRHAFYYARELTFYGKHREAITELNRYLELPGATWKEERAFAMRLLGDMHHALGDKETALSWYEKGVIEAPNRREPWLALTEFCYKTSNWERCYSSATRCIATPSSKQWPTDSRSEGFLPHDCAAIAAYRLGRMSDAVRHGQNALTFAPNDERLKTNMKWYLGEM